jgi:hypothetical protein
MTRRRNTFAILLQIVAAVLTCVTTAVPAAARRSATPAIVAAGPSVPLLAQRQRAAVRHAVAKVDEVRRDGPPPSSSPLPAALPSVGPARSERTAISSPDDAALPRLAIHRPNARGPPR